MYRYSINKGKPLHYIKVEFLTGQVFKWLMANRNSNSQFLSEKK
jgi:hypothetical protein